MHGASPGGQDWGELCCSSKQEAWSLMYASHQNIFGPFPWTCCCRPLIILLADGVAALKSNEVSATRHQVSVRSQKCRAQNKKTLRGCPRLLPRPLRAEGCWRNAWFRWDDKHPAQSSDPLFPRLKVRHQNPERRIGTILRAVNPATISKTRTLHRETGPFS